jgi:hypothetical protein
VLTQFSATNLGCKRRVSSGLDWVFSKVEEAIILEDDCLPSLSFFSFCQVLLDRYRHDKRIFLVSGDNFQFGRRRTDFSYYFSRYPHIWGWASWRRAWENFDASMSSWPTFSADGHLASIIEDPVEQRYWATIFEQCYREEIDSWAFPWTYACWRQGALTILPEVNLVSNIGFGQNATHTGDSTSSIANLPTGELWTIRHPKNVVRLPDADSFTFKNVFSR